MSVAGRRGSVRQDAAGRWSFVVDVATPGGPRRQVRRRGFPTKKTAQAALTDTLGKLGEGSYVEPSKLTVRDYVETRWLPVVQGELRASTYQSYSRNLRVHVLSRIGALRLQALDPGTLQALYGELLQAGRADHERGSGLAPRTVHYIHTIIRSALTTAVGWDLIPRNPADRVKPPRQQAQANRHQHIRPWTREELRTFLDATHGERLFPLWRLLATSGLRCGEALGLGWTAVDLDRGSVSIRRSLVDVARVRRARLPGIRLHDLRHTWATLALEADVHPKVVSERLGHSTVTITLTIYSHVMPAMHTAAEGVAGFILGTPNDQGDGPPGGARVPLSDQPVTTTPT